MIRHPFGREERAFLLNVPQWQAIERASDCGLQEIAQRLAPLIHLLRTGTEGRTGGLLGAVASGAMGSARLTDVIEICAQGLIGGENQSPTAAYAVVRAVFQEAMNHGHSPLLEFGPLAWELASRAVIGFEEEQPGEPKGAAGKAKAGRRRSREARPASPRSTPAQA